jgi:hypothetical protein
MVSSSGSAKPTVAAANYTSLSLTFANPELTFQNNSGTALAGCANGAVCQIKPTGTLTSMLNGTFYVTGASQNGFLVDLNLASIISSSLAVDFSSANAVSATQKTTTGGGELQEVEDADGIGTLVHIIGTLYSVLYAFATYVIWGQFTAVENEILKESGSLKNLLVFSRPLPEKERDPIVRAVKTYARNVVETEWGALSRREETEKTDRLFLQIVSSVAEIRPEDDTQRVIFERLLEIANQASAHRDERLALSLKRMPRTLFLFVSLTAFMILVLVLIYPFHGFMLGLASVAITSALLLFAHFVLSDLDNPFEGTWNVGNEPFGELITRFS